MGKIKQLEGKVMHWNYRIARKKTNCAEGIHYSYFIVEAYYDKNGKIGMITAEATSPYGENIEELASGFEKMKGAFYAPIIDYDNIPEPGYIESEEIFDENMSEEEIADIIEKEKHLDNEFIKISEEEKINLNKQDELERINKENEFNELIKNHTNNRKNHNFELKDFYKKD